MEDELQVLFSAYVADLSQVRLSSGACAASSVLFDALRCSSRPSCSRRTSEEMTFDYSGIMHPG